MPRLRLDILNETIGGNVRNNQGHHHGSTNGVRCGDESFSERYGEEVLVEDPFDRADNTVCTSAFAEGDPGLPGL